MLKSDNPMKTLHTGNMTNFGYAFTKLLLKEGVFVDINQQWNTSC